MVALWMALLNRNAEIQGCGYSFLSLCVEGALLHGLLRIYIPFNQDILIGKGRGILVQMGFVQSHEFLQFRQTAALLGKQQTAGHHQCITAERLKPEYAVPGMVDLDRLDNAVLYLIRKLHLMIPFAVIHVEDHRIW